MKNVYNVILSGGTDEEALAYAAGMVWSEVEFYDNDIKYKRYVGSMSGVGVYYDFGMDYYFFTEDKTMELEWVYDEENEVLIAQSNTVPYRHYIIEDGAWWHLRVTQALGLVPNQGKNLACDVLSEAKQLANAYEQARLDGVGVEEI